MSLVFYAPPTEVQPGYSLESPVDVALSDTAGAPLEFCRFSLEPQASTLLDYHEEYEIWFILSGNGVLDIDDARLSVSGGSTIHFKPHVRHKLFNCGTELMRVISVYWGAR